MGRYRRRNGVGFFRYLGDVVDDTKDFVDDILDRDGDSYNGIRGGLEQDDRSAIHRDLQALKTSLDELSAKLDQLGTRQLADKK
ncbi:hypothetical protein ABZ816_00070 [Actinosynnema sp. NPDC047251]|uniref:Uncharacterized protein n=1 Tax=Saccharothrix espanaensis (strain ATCC 51144 / DSM 44229 / JCM 9112 / NBRC 15066 / NRRL 15764) TaxID=1179773 RepID=K0K1B8_SACES|nr:hypothetical protein [Saccharothrix espanaensis]CCH30644.1 hypothetical protein BN6_33420 [Saccharothrix espanaensis DSM 44229]